jgi:hypothetical protein
MTIQKQIFDAHMIGDGSLLYRHKGKNKHRSFTLTNKHKTYLQWVSSKLDCLNNRSIWFRGGMDKRTNKNYNCYHIIGLQCPRFDDEYVRWYTNNGQKDIPPDINVGPEFLLHWFLDDGSLATHGGVYFAVDSYTLESINMLKNRLEKLLGFVIGIHKNGKGFRLYIAKKHSQKFFEFIGTCPVQEYEYKWG